MSNVDPPKFVAFKQSARKLHEAGKVGEARRRLIGSKIRDRELITAVGLIDAWLERQPRDVREYALAKPAPRMVTSAPPP